MVDPINTHSDTGRFPRALFGRERDQSILRQAFDSALNGQGRLVLISGEAGIGKTALVNDLLVIAREHGALVLTGHSYDLTMTPPYGPWTEIMESYQKLVELPPLPVSLTDSDAFEALPDRTVLFREVRDVVTAASEMLPLVIVIEDLHWADQASLDLLRYLGRQVVDIQNALLVTTYRDDEVTRAEPLHQLLPLIVGESQAIRIDLQRLDQLAIREMVRSYYPLVPQDEARLVTYLHEQAEGNPLYLGELMRSIEADAILRPGENHWTLDYLLRTRTPPLVRQVIERRLEKLTAQTRSHLEHGAIIGQTMPLPLWLEVSDASQEVLDRSVQEAVEAHVIEETPDGSQLRFTHALVRETIYESVMLPRRRTLHLHVAEALAASSTISAGVIAYHFQQAGDERALQWLIRAGEDAFRSWAWIEAADRYAAAIAFVENREDMLQEHAWLALKLAKVLRESSPRDAISYCEDALKAAQRLNDNALEALATFSLGEIRFFAGGNGLPEIHRGNEALRHLPAEDVSRLKHYVRGVDVEHGTPSIVLAQSVTGHYQDALAGARDYLAQGRPRVDFLWPEQGHAEVACAYALFALGEPAEARAAFRRAQECYLQADMVWFCAQAASFEMLYVTLAYDTDNLNERQRLATEIEHLWTQTSGILIHLPPRYGLLPLLVVEGNWSEARELVAPFANRDVMHHDAGLWALGVIARNQGDTQLAWSSVRTIFPEGPHAGAGSMPMMYTLDVLRLAAELALDGGDVSSAGEWIDAYDSWIDLGGRILGRAESHLLHAQRLLAAGNQDRARASGMESLQAATKPRQPLAQIAALRFLGELDVMDRKPASADDHLRQSLDLAVACRAPYEQALSLIAFAGLRQNTGQSSEALTLLDEAAALCEGLGAKTALTKIEELRAEVAAAPASSPSYPMGLTAREVDVLALVADGLTDAEVADRLFIARRTVTSHLTSIYTKLGVSSRAAATRFAVEQGLTT